MFQITLHFLFSKYFPIFYQEPVCMDPLDPDPGKNGAKSDHRIVLVRPISTINNKSIRRMRKVEVRAFPQSGFDLYKEWLMDQSWDQVFSAVSAHTKAQIFQEMLVTKLDEIFPVRIRKIGSDDQPWVTFQLKKLDRMRKRVFNKERKSKKWKIWINFSKKHQNVRKQNFISRKCKN